MRLWRRDRAVIERSDLVASEADVRAAYRLLLGREPDEKGLSSHLDWIAQQRPKPSAVAQRFMESDEYRARTTHSQEYVPVDMGGYVVFARPGDKLIGAEVIASRRYEGHVSDWFENSLAPGAYVLDVGANIGIYTMRAAARVGDAGRVIAVEPLPQNHQALFAGIVHNKFSNVQVMPFAASDRPGLILAICAADSSNGIVGAHGVDDRIETYVPTCRLDDLLANLPRLDVVKIDIEGHEPVAWKGMESLLKRHRPAVFSEFSPVAIRNLGQDPLEYLRLLFAHGPRLTVLHRDARTVQCRDPDSVMQEWRDANRIAGLDGAMHLDLYLASANEP